MTTRHFLTTGDFSSDELEYLIQRGIELKRMHASNSVPASGEEYQPFKGRVLAMIFEKSSTRTRVSFEAGMAQFGGQALFLSSRDTQLGRGEPVEDSAKVLSRMVDMIMIRTYSHSNLERFAQHSRVPVINALTDDFHPCQLLADMQTYYEHRGSIRGRTVAWIGDGNNMCNSYIDAAAGYGFKLRIACPEGYRPDQSLLDSADVHLANSLEEAVDGADLVATDVWASMGHEEEALERARVFAPYQVTPELMARAGSGALFMHCLPAHRGEEVSEDMLNHTSSVVWDEAENRLHAQKALMEFLLLGRVG